MSDAVGYRAYASEDVVTGEGVAVELPVASLLHRLGGALIDWIVYLAVFIGALISVLNVDFSSDAVAMTVVILVIVTCLVIIPATVEFLTGGRSLGKLALGRGWSATTAGGSRRGTASPGPWSASSRCCSRSCREA